MPLLEEETTHALNLELPNCDGKSLMHTSTRLSNMANPNE